MGRVAHNRKHGKRTKSGELSRSRKAVADRVSAEIAESETEAVSVVVSARIRSGVSPKLARDPRAGTVQGRLHLEGRISLDEYEAAEWYLARRNDYLVAKQAPGAVYDAPDGLSCGDEDAHERFVSAACARWSDIEACIVDASFKHPSINFVGALDLMLVRQWRDDLLILDLRAALVLLHRLKSGKRKFN